MSYIDIIVTVVPYIAWGLLLFLIGVFIYDYKFRKKI